jgi:RNA polymerase sigma-70 factor, ECF subfamily
MSLQRRIVGEIPHLRRFARSLTRNADEADDLVQAVLERALGRLHLLWKPGSLRPWLFRMMYNLHINTRLRDARVSRAAESDRPFLDHAVPATQESRLETRSVIEAIASLPDEQRAAISLTAIEELSYQEAADVLDIPLGTLMSRLHRARTKLKAMMEHPGQHREPAAHLRRVK